MRRAWLIGLIAAAVACGDPDQFGLRVTWSQGPIQACPLTADGVTSCSAIALSCGARARLRIVDAVDDTRVFFTACYDVPPGDDMCGLRDVALPSAIEIPNQMVRIQLQVWSIDALVEAGLPAAECPTFGHFDVLGFPQLNAYLIPSEPVPALGREIYFPVGQREVATIELGCPRADLLDTPTCQTRALDVEATLLVPGSWRSVSTLEAGSINVRFGPTVERGGDTLLDERSLIPLDLVAGPEPRWRAEVGGPIEGLRCLQAFVVTAGAVPVAACAEVPAPVAGAVPMVGYWPDPALVGRVIELVNALRGVDEFPSQGIVIGFVIDRDNQPVLGATVTPTAGTIVYPNLTLDGWEPATGPSGLFVSLDAPIASHWDATAPGLADDDRARGGVIANHVTAVVVRMDPAL
ncbi:MAG: hypothetical protein IPL61_15680 [Myxococcales bacterium]|nr:hypothetical protein [Myxococcales bacterium]